MIVVKIENDQHPGCCLSDVSKELPELNFSVCLSEYTATEFEILYLVKDDEGVYPDPATIIKLISLISDHHSAVYNRLANDDNSLFKLRVSDTLYTRGVIRAIMDEKDARLPPMQCMKVKSGAEIVYAVFRNNAARARLQERLSRNIGPERMHFSILSDAANKAEVIDLIPSFFDELLPNEVATLFKQIQKDSFLGRPFDEGLLERLRDTFEKIETPLWLTNLGLELLKIFKIIPY